MRSLYANLQLSNFKLTVEFEVVMGPGQIFLTQVRSGQFFIARVSHLWFRFGFGKFPLKIPNFPIFSLRIKKLLRIGSKMGGPLIWSGHGLKPITSLRLFLLKIV